MLFKKDTSLSECGAFPSLVQHAGSLSCSAGVSPAVLWLMLSLASYHSQGGPAVVLGMETPLGIIQSRALTDFRTGQCHAPWEMDLDLILAKAM